MSEEFDRAYITEQTRAWVAMKVSYLLGDKDRVMVCRKAGVSTSRLAAILEANIRVSVEELDLIARACGQKLKDGKA